MVKRIVLRTAQKTEPSLPGVTYAVVKLTTDERKRLANGERLVVTTDGR